MVKTGKSIPKKHIGNIIAKTDVAPLQLIVHLLFQANPVFGQPAALAGQLTQLLKDVIRNKTASNQVFLQTLRYPMRIFHIALTTG
jgi:hypothetical protein